MSKITAKHFLNTNLKPYLINKEKHYSIYISLVAYRKNTKVKSITFDEYYSEDTFNDIINSVDEYDINLIENEISIITLITELTVSVLKEFDTAFITAYFKFSSIINVDSYLEYDKYLQEKGGNINDVSGIIDRLEKFEDFFKIVESVEVVHDWSYRIEKEIKDITFVDWLKPKFSGMSIFDFFNKENQTKLMNYTSEKIESPLNNDFIFEYNKAIFINSLNRFSNYISKTKNEYLIEKYNTVFMDSYNAKKLFRWKPIN
ncbi:hypothetical protein [Elizabethkingia meningoseptica]|uniref:Uncharacterized protein n=1 Tax=Elizabethkingia meningoseptica TaxID=238 RepID=A0A1T3FKV5_ELIME|nr:hypothetical protein [Elizabethkingia meningoseptica]AQX13494.1 hypothetical protein BBD35_14430 [Elizabethkingia meningoseptica]MBG0515140.1 hypothetical protein [Elizabethkingia meningoseptica]MDE5434360.1 hypothetical protein [Elizabethkingia meningoseptica]OOH96220.1 hypothetical protein BMF97_07680 [Elizabethkingia meningoseptica]OPB78450.1 hypothetical protein BAY31_17025 [Elizabethkingia meningoseptica]